MLNIQDLVDKYTTTVLYEEDDIKLEMTTEIVNGGRAGITAKTYYEIFLGKRRIHKDHSLESAVAKFNELLEEG